MAAKKKKKMSPVRWIVRLIVVVILAYVLWPLYIPNSPTKPTSSNPGDHVTIKVADTTKDGIYQQVTLYRDGRNTIQMTRAQGDPDLPDGGGWKISRDKKTKIASFEKEGLIDKTHAQYLFLQVLKLGALDMVNEPAKVGNTMTLTTSFTDGNSIRSLTVRGPVFLARSFYWEPSRWRNRMRWQKLYLLIKKDPTLSKLMFHRDIQLVNE